MKFFRFLTKDNVPFNELSDNLEDTQYKIGDKIVADIDENDEGTFWEPGIHCIKVKGENEIVGDFISFGSKVAILKAKKEDILHEREDGTCRLSKCEVIDIIDAKELLEKLKNKRISGSFFLRILSYIPEIEYNKKHLCLILDIFTDDNFYGISFDTLNNYFNKLDKYYPEIEEYLLGKELYDYALIYAINKKQYNDPKLKEYVENMKYERLGLKSEWKKIFGEKEEKNTA